MNLLTMTPKELDKAIADAEKKVAQATKAANAQRATENAERAAGEYEAEQRQIAEAAEDGRRRDLFEAESRAQASLDAIRKTAEALRIEGLRHAAENSPEGRSLLARAQADFDIYGDGRIRDASSDETRRQASRVFRQHVGVTVDPDAFVDVDPGSWADLILWDVCWRVAWNDSTPPTVTVVERRPGNNYGEGAVLNHELQTLASLVSVVRESAGLEALRATFEPAA